MHTDIIMMIEQSSHLELIHYPLLPQLNQKVSKHIIQFYTAHHITLSMIDQFSYLLVSLQFIYFEVAKYLKGFSLSIRCSWYCRHLTFQINFVFNWKLNVVLIFLFFFFLKHVFIAGRLKCHCDSCPQSTCETDGLCFTSVEARKNELTYSYR